MFAPTTSSPGPQIPPAQRAALACRECGALYAGFVGIGTGRCQLCPAPLDQGDAWPHRAEKKRGLLGFVIVLAVALAFLAFRYGVTA